MESGDDHEGSDMSGDDLEFEDLVCGHSKHNRELIVKVKSWVDLRKQLDEILKKELNQCWTPFAQVRQNMYLEMTMKC